MRILHVISALAAGGAECLVRDLSIELAEQGHTPGVAFISSARDQGNDAAFEDDFKDRLGSRKIATFEIGYAARRNPFLGARRLRAVIAEFKPDVLHIHLATALAFRLVALINIPTVYTHHSVRFRFNKSVFKLFNTVVDGYVAISETNRRILAELTTVPITKIYNGVSSKRFNTERKGADGKHIDVLSVGTLIEPKDYDTLIASAAIISREITTLGYTIKFRIAGDGARLSELRDKVSQQGLEGVVEFLGARTDVPKLMAESDLMLMTSIYEGLPISLIEALYSGLPIVATDVGGCREIVQDGFNGVLAEPRNSQAIADKVLGVLGNKKVMVEFSKNAYHAAKQFSIETCAKKHVDLYRLHAHEGYSRQAGAA